MYENPVERVTLVTTGSDIDLTVDDKNGKLPQVTISGDVASATTFRYGLACLEGFGCVTADEQGGIFNCGQTLQIELQGRVFSYSFVGSGNALISSEQTQPHGIDLNAPSFIEHLRLLTAE